MKTITKSLILISGLGIGLAATGALLAHSSMGFMGGPGMMNGGYGNPAMMQQGYGTGNTMGPGMMGGSNMMQGRGMGPGMMGQLGEANLPEIKKTLNLTPDQETAWNNYAQTIQAHQALGQASHQAMWSSQESSNPSLHNNLHQSMWESRQKVTDALNNLRTSLTLEQLQKTEQLFGQNCFNG